MEENSTAQVKIMLGSNTGDRKANLDNAVKALSGYVDSAAATRDIDNPDFTGRGPAYLNRLLTGTTRLSLPALKTAMKEIETALGRDRSTSHLVKIDIDIVVYGDEIVKPSEYTSPPCQALLHAPKTVRIAVKKIGADDWGLGKNR